MKDSIIELRNISKYYKSGKKKINVLNNISLSIKEGEFIGIKGVSGAGKTTLLNIIAGITKPRSGDIYVYGKKVGIFRDRFMSRVRRRFIGFVFQNFNLIPYYTVYENILMPVLFGGKLYFSYKRDVMNIASMLGIGDKLYEYPHRLSGGEAQRCAIARALIRKPKLILADEPTGNLDNKTEKEIMNIFKKLNKNGMTFIIVSHSSYVHRHCNILYEIKDGNIIQVK